MLVFGVLQDILPSLNAYSLTTLLIILANTMAAYLYLLHPDGVSLAFHNFSLPHMAIFASLQAIMPPVAFNLTHLFLVFLTSTAGYVYLNYLFRDEWIALFGTCRVWHRGIRASAPSTPQYRLHRHAASVAVFSAPWAAGITERAVTFGLLLAP